MLRPFGASQLADDNKKFKFKSEGSSQGFCLLLLWGPYF